MDGWMDGSKDLWAEQCLWHVMDDHLCSWECGKFSPWTVFFYYYYYYYLNSISGDVRRPSSQLWCIQKIGVTRITLFKVFSIWQPQKIPECCFYLVPAARVRVNSIYNAAGFIPKHPSSTWFCVSQPGINTCPRAWSVRSLFWLTLSGVLCVIVKASPRCLYPQHSPSCCTLSSLRMLKENLMEAKKKKTLSRFPITVTVNCCFLFMFRVCVCVFTWT